MTETLTNDGCCHKTRIAGAPCPIGRDCPYITATAVNRESGSIRHHLLVALGSAALIGPHVATSELVEHIKSAILALPKQDDADNG